MGEKEAVKMRMSTRVEVIFKHLKVETYPIGLMLL